MADENENIGLLFIRPKKRVHSEQLWIWIQIAAQNLVKAHACISSPLTAFITQPIKSNISGPVANDDLTNNKTKLIPNKLARAINRAAITTNDV